MLPILISSHDCTNTGFLVDPVDEISTQAVATKPTWELGSATTVKITDERKPISSVWSMSAVSASDDLVDENELLNDNISVKRVSGCDEDGPPQPGRRACKNCSCGLKEEEEAALQAGIKLDVNDSSMGKSACGNCAKGDAFRCASCPHRGKPAFQDAEIGGSIKLALADDI